ncbi:MAG: HDOD domain-containing protein [Planctomycetaceae bacterium]
MSVSEPITASRSDSGWKELFDRSIAEMKAMELPDDVQIPSLPWALTEFLQAAADPDIEIRKLGQIIECDPGMTVDLLKCVNIATHGSAKPIRSATEALIRMGVPNARNHLMGAGLRSATLAYESRLMNHGNFWNESLRRGLFAQHAARKINTDSDLAFVGGLLQDFVLPVLTNQFDSDYIDFMREAAPAGKNLADWERETFGWDHATTAALMAQRWNMPDDLLCAILLHHRMDLPLKSPDKEVFHLFPVTLAALLPDQLSQVSNGVRQLVTADQRSSIFDLNELCDAVDDEVEAIAEGHEAPMYLSPIVLQTRDAMLAGL